jgi:hypothetical protein
MHFRRFACFLVGIWLTGGLFMAMVATQNFHAVDRLLAKPAVPAAVELNKLGPVAARALLRYHSAELNRLYFETWENAELAIGLVLMLVLLFGSDESKWTLSLPLAMLTIALVQRFVLTPEIVALGRIIDFVPVSPPTEERNRFWVLHGVFTSLELLKWVLGLLLTARLVFRRRRRPHEAEEIPAGSERLAG